MYGYGRLEDYMASKINIDESTIHTDTFVRGDYSVGIRANLSNIQYANSDQKKQLDKLYRKDYSRLEKELKSKK